MTSHRVVTALVAVVVPGLVVSACAGGARSAAPPAAVPSPTVTTSHAVVDRDGMPSPFRIVHEGHELELGPHTYCYTTECVDGWDENPPSVGSPGAIHVLVTTPEFDAFDAVATGDLGPDGTRAEDADWTGLKAEQQDDGWWLVTPDVPAGEYVVMLTARGEGAGSMVADLRWEIPANAG
jgi:hypothetical protein